MGAMNILIYIQGVAFLVFLAAAVTYVQPGATVVTRKRTWRVLLWTSYAMTANIFVALAWRALL